MIRKDTFDKFFDLQPDREFVELLKTPVHAEPPMNWGNGKMLEGEFTFSGMYINADFPDEKGVLETAYADFNEFLKVCKITGDNFPVNIIYKESEVFESYTVDIKEDGITLSAGDTEGIRRGLVWIENELSKNEGPFLKEKTVSKTPHIEDRITRGFFSPTNRPPKNGDELSDDIDYYPDEYLNRLAHDGTNGLWIYTKFKDILPSNLVKEYGKGHEARLEKLKKVIKNCARYGIKVFVFAIEPGAHDGALDTHPEARGASAAWGGGNSFCTETEFGKAYCAEATRTMAELLPDLGGHINITTGERITNCSNSVNNDCPHCSHLPRGRILAGAVDALTEGFRQAKSNMKMVSWTYGHRGWQPEDIEDYVKYAPSDAYLMQNFDDMGTPVQLGKKRLAADYWLAYAGPSQMFIDTAEACKKYGKKLFAKMQICCSHEVASVPYVPVPGLVFEKFKGAFELGVKGVMECWYFGNYPCFMSKAAGELSFLHDFSDEDAFLEELAAMHWGRTNAKQVVKAWKLFTKGYENYPVNVMFNYYGPMHDGIVWELQLIPKNFSLARTWFSVDKTDGDRIEECLFGHHTIDEAEILTKIMSDNWNLGLEELKKIPECDGYIYAEQIACAKALGILFESGHNILRFYQLRELMGFEKGDASKQLAEMKKIVIEEIRLTKEMIPLCEKDKRLGYHSEAENFKFFPLKLEHRIKQLENLLITEFVEIEKRIADGLVPFEYYKGVEDDIPHYQMGKDSLDNASWVDLDKSSNFRAAYDKENLYFEFKSKEKFTVRFSPEFTLMHVDPTIEVTEECKFKHGYNNKLYHGLHLDDGMAKLKNMWNITPIPADEGMHFTVTLKRDEIGWTNDEHLMKLRVGFESHETGHMSLWAKEPNPVYTLGKSEVSPGQFVWLMP